MTRERWAQVERVLDAVLDREPHEWNAAIAELCGPDAELRAEVESLVARHGAAQRFLEVPAPAAIAAGWGGFAEDANPVDPREASPVEETQVSDPLVGSSVAHYRIVARLGGGGMGVVYRARDTRLERDVALKFLPPHLGLDSRAKSRFMVEARAAAALDHPNICTVHEIGEAGDGRLFIAMACYQGHVLKERIANGPLPPEAAVAVAVGIARALDAAHARGIVHRDVKPANVMLTADGGVKLLDFGVAKLADVTITQSGVTPGTVAYMAPEQIRGENADARSDLWSLGVVLHEMLTSARPFLGSHDAAVMQAILHGDPPPLGESSGEPTATLQTIVRRLLAKNPDERYQSARQLLADLEPVAAADRRVLAADAVREPWSKSSGRTRDVARRGGGLVESVRRAASWKRMAALATLVLVAVAGWIAASRFAKAHAEIRRIAVLPLANLTGDPELGHFVDGVHYALSAELSKIQGLSVHSRQSVLRYRDSERPLPEIARELGVDALLEGAVFKSGDSVRITVQLLRARPEQQMLAASHAGPLEHALVLHNVVAREIADSIHARLAPADARERRAAKRVVSPAAEKAFLAGLYHLERSMKAELITGPAQLKVLDSAIHHFKEAIALEPEWSAPYARLSTAYRVSTETLPEDAAADYHRGAKAAALRAVALDETDAEAHASLAIELAFHDWDWAGADRAIRRSLETRSIRASLRRCSDHDGGRAARRSDDAVAEGRGPLSALGEAEIVGGDGIWLRRTPRRRHRQGERAERPRDAIRSDQHARRQRLAVERTGARAFDEGRPCQGDRRGGGARRARRPAAIPCHARLRLCARRTASRSPDARRADGGGGTIARRSMETRACLCRAWRHPARARHGRRGGERTPPQRDVPLRHRVPGAAERTANARAGAVVGIPLGRLSAE